MVAAAAAGAIGNIGAGILGNKAQKKMQKKALAAQKETALRNIALANQSVARSGQYLDPYAVSGMRSGNVLMEMLLGPQAGGGGGGVATPNALAQIQAPTTPDAQAQLDFLLSGSSDVIGPKRTKKINKFQGTPEQKLAYAKSLMHSGERSAYESYMTQNTVQPSPYASLQQPQTDATGQPVSALSAFEQFRNSNDYQWRQDEAERAVANNFGSDYESPAAQLALQDRASHIANQEMGNWMDRLFQQQGMGFNAANSMAGYGTAATSAAMGVGQNLADNMSNMYGAQGQGAANMWGNVAQGIGNVAGAYAKTQQAPPSGAGTGYGGSSYGMNEVYNLPPEYQFLLPGGTT